jgi:hypothetical protein
MIVMGLGQVSGAATIAATIQQMEGYYPGTASYINNNPGNLMYVGQAGATKSPSGFAVFPTYDDGYQALIAQIQNYANRGLTIDQMMNLYAPAPSATCTTACAGNNPTLYANTIATALGVDPTSTVADAISGSGTSVASSSTSGDDSMSIPTLDPFSQAFSDIGSAVSSGDISSISGEDFLVLGGMALGLWMLGAWLAK